MGFLGIPFEEKIYKVNLTADGQHEQSEWEAEKDKLGLKDPKLPYFIHGETKITDAAEISRYIAVRWGPQLLGITPEEKFNVENLLA